MLPSFDASVHVRRQLTLLVFIFQQRPSDEQRFLHSPQSLHLFTMPLCHWRSVTLFCLPVLVFFLPLTWTFPTYFPITRSCATLDPSSNLTSTHRWLQVNEPKYLHFPSSICCPMINTIPETTSSTIPPSSNPVSPRRSPLVVP